MTVVLIVSSVLVAWVLQAIGVSRAMRRRGFAALPWFVTSLVLGPAAWTLAVAEARGGPPGPVILRWGTPAQGVIDVLVALEGDEVPPETVAQLRRVLQYSRRVVLARVVGAGGPAHIVKDAERFLIDAAARLRLDGAELHLLYGDLDAVVAGAQRRHEFGIILRSDQPAELFDGDGPRQEVRCVRDVSAA